MPLKNTTRLRPYRKELAMCMWMGRSAYVDPPVHTLPLSSSHRYLTTHTSRGGGVAARKGDRVGAGG